MKERLVDCIHRAEKKDSKDELQRDIKKKNRRGEGEASL